MAERSRNSRLTPRYKKNASIIRIGGACILLCLVFCAGFFVRGNDALMNKLGVSNSASQNAQTTMSAANTYDSVAARVAEVEEVFGKDSLDEYDLDKATDAVMKSYLSVIDDSYVHYYDAESYNKYLNSVVNPDAGVGILFGEQDGTCYAVDVCAGSQAEALGVKTGDFVDSIDGIHKDTWTMAEVVSALNREVGSSVVVKWRHVSDAAANTASNTTSGSSSSSDTFYTTTLTYAETEQENISYSVSDGVCVIDIKQLSSDSAKVVEAYIKDALKKEASAFVLDLRNVSGGYLTQAVDIASCFVESGTIVQIQTNDNTTTRSANGELITDKPVVVLVNDKTAGAAEVLAAALQEVDGATVVGTITQGKGSVQAIQPLSFGGAIRYTAAVYLTPNGRSLDGAGVSPDITVRSKDQQYHTAFEIARSRVN